MGYFAGDVRYCDWNPKKSAPPDREWSLAITRIWSCRNTMTTSEVARRCHRTESMTGRYSGAVRGWHNGRNVSYLQTDAEHGRARMGWAGRSP